VKVVKGQVEVTDLRTEKPEYYDASHKARVVPRAKDATAWQAARDPGHHWEPARAPCARKRHRVGNIALVMRSQL